MKQKFTLTIADIQLSVIADASFDEVEHIRGLLDRKMREIYLKSRCPKTEAALLCAMDFAADRMSMQSQISELEERCDKYAIVLENLKERTSDQSAELERLRSENAVLRSLLTKQEEEAEALALDPISPAAFFAEVAEAQALNTTLSESLDAEESEEKVEAEPVAVFSRPEPAPAPAPIPAPAEEPAPAEKKPEAEAPRPRSRVGNMFRHLSFGDLD
ncbi:MAG: hypothetical protein E7610_00275 [Ruminococcaceae bacterium]|nr:hypothetical protein [Oscillospiraceae bacterium]